MSTHIDSSLRPQRALPLLALLIGALVFTSCRYNYTTPPPQAPADTLWGRTMTIHELKSLYKTGPLLVVPNAVIVGQVVSDDSEGNIYKSLYLQDETGGIEFKAGLVNSHLLYKRGAHMAIRCHGLTLGKYGGLVTLGAASVDPKYENAYLPEAVTPHLVCCERGHDLLQIRDLTISELSEEYAGTLIRLDHVQFVDSQLGQTYADPANKESVSAVERLIEDQAGKTIVLRSSSYALFAGKPLPSGSGTITAILGYFNGKPQLTISLESDINFTRPRF